MKDEIIRLRAEGKSYKEVAKIVGCSKTLAIYHSNSDQKEKAKFRKRVERKNNPLGNKLVNFKGKAFRTKVSDFKKIDKDSSVTQKEVFERINENPVCYLTGRKIDLEDTTSYHFDHVVPVSKGGNGSLENLGLACKEANKAKNDLSVEEFIILCKDVLENFGYEIKQRE